MRRVDGFTRRAAHSFQKGVLCSRQDIGANMERRLSAILSADVFGYSRLMGEEEVGTLAETQSLPSGASRSRNRRVPRAYRQAHGRRRAS